MAETDLAYSTESLADAEPDSGLQMDNGANSNEENGDHDTDTGADGALNTNYDSCDGTILVSFFKCLSKGSNEKGKGFMKETLMVTQS